MVACAGVRPGGECAGEGVREGAGGVGVREGDGGGSNGKFVDGESPGEFGGRIRLSSCSFCLSSCCQTSSKLDCSVGKYSPRARLESEACHCSQSSTIRDIGENIYSNL